MAESTITLRQHYGIPHHPDDFELRRVIDECCNYICRYPEWEKSVDHNFQPMAGDLWEYEQALLQSIFELEALGWQFEPPQYLIPEWEFELWLSLR